jgi:hypothetical protein
LRRYRHVIKFLVVRRAFYPAVACSGGGEANQAAAVPFPTTTPFVSARAGKKRHRDTVFTVDYNFSAGLNPYSCSDGTNLILTGLVYEPLFAVARTFHTARPRIGLERRRVDFSIYNKKLGVVFHDGERADGLGRALFGESGPRLGALQDAAFDISEAWIENGRLNIALTPRTRTFPFCWTYPSLRTAAAMRTFRRAQGPYRLGEYGGAVFLKAFEAHRDYGSLPPWAHISEGIRAGGTCRSL